MERKNSDELYLESDNESVDSDYLPPMLTDRPKPVYEVHYITPRTFPRWKLLKLEKMGFIVEKEELDNFELPAGSYYVLMK